ncbi:DUF547 domain-containing protein [Seonamhaeicola sp. ML3]|uniref:DUF547 domain-containing protein n=1 Tax=Seonamhaeicola sp. ML3 TaxID=2937786 RepID=UPI00200DD9F0|nr:DUF547 domain-containing protein [Seonamhaeicola sp. ML3]
MKIAYLFGICLVLTSCVGTKKVASNTSQKPQNIEKNGNELLEKEASQTVSSKDSLIISQQNQTIETYEEPIVEHETTLYFPEKISHDSWNGLLAKHVSDKGHVNYKGFKKDKTKLNEYIKLLGNNLPNSEWPKTQKLAYWINAYNAFTIDLILRHYPLESIKDIKNPWKQRYWKLGNKWYNLDEIEHEILRKMDEPRIHFAINCASISCPILLNQAYTPESLEEQLTTMTRRFIADSTKNDLSKDPIELSKIFKWFSKDFQNGDSTLVEFLNTYSDNTIYSSTKRTFKDYNWNLNE